MLDMATVSSAYNFDNTMIKQVIGLQCQTNSGIPQGVLSTLNAFQQELRPYSQITTPAWLQELKSFVAVQNTWKAPDLQTVGQSIQRICDVWSPVMQTITRQQYQKWAIPQIETTMLDLIQSSCSNLKHDAIGIVDGMFSVTVEAIVGIVEKFKDLKPVVIVDYLQIVAPSMSMDGRRTLDSRESIDHIVHELKALQSKLDLTILAISSLNRQNYLIPVDFESFKESGGIEYTADVIWGLQLSIMSDKLFGKEANIKEKRDMVRLAKAATPREIDLVCLKNRYGRSSYRVGFHYYPKSDIFIPVL